MPAPRRGKRDGAARDRLLRLAQGQFARRGYGATSMRQVAAAAGIQAASLYHHWPSKEALYAAVVEDVNAQLRVIVRDALAVDAPLEEQLRGAVSKVFGFFLDQPNAARLNLRTILGDEQRDRRTAPKSDGRWLGLVEGFLQPLVARRQIKQIDLTRFLISASAVITVHAVAFHDAQSVYGREISGPKSAKETTDHVAEVILRILGLG